MTPVLWAQPVQLDLKAPLARKDLKVTLVPLVLLELRAQLVLWGLPAQLDPKVPPVYKDLKETPVQPALLELRAPLVLRGLPVRLARQGCKALRDLLDQPEALAADRNFKLAALSWSQLESAA